MSHWRGGIKRDKTDQLFSFLVRMRVNYTCQYCGRNFLHDTGKAHCSHIYGRRSKGVRWHPLNALCHCYSCHGKLGENPPLFTQHAREVLGEDYEKLMRLANKPTKFSAFDKEIIHKHLLVEKKKMLECRAGGHEGRIDFTMFPIGVLQ